MKAHTLFPPFLPALSGGGGGFWASVARGASLAPVWGALNGMRRYALADG